MHVHVLLSASYTTCREAASVSLDENSVESQKPSKYGPMGRIEKQVRGGDNKIRVMSRRSAVYQGNPRAPNRALSFPTPGWQLVGCGIGVRGCSKPNTRVRRVVHRVKTLSKDQQVSNFL